MLLSLLLFRSLEVFFIQKWVDESQPFYYISNMTKEEYIAKYGEDAWTRKCEQSRLCHKQKYDNDLEYYEKKKARNRIHNAKWRKTHKDYVNDASLKSYHDRMADPVYRKKRLETVNNIILKFKYEMGDAGNFATTQYTTLRREHIEDLDKYILENLSREAYEIDGDPRLVNEDFLYDCFIENCRYGLFYGNLQVIKYFVPLMCVKVHKGIEFTDKNIEMIKVFDEYRNTTKKKPIEYSFKMYYIRLDQKNDLDMNVKCMLLYNLSADFMHKRSRYPTDKKLY